MSDAKTAARLLVHLGYPDAQVEATMRKKFPDADVDELLEEARTHRQWVDEELEDADRA